MSSTTRKPSLISHSTAKIVADGKAAAKSAGLRYVDDRRPGIARARRGKGFGYLTVDGKPMRDGKGIWRNRCLPGAGGRPHRFPHSLRKNRQSWRSSNVN